jgi:hypothetical protein
MKHLRGISFLSLAFFCCSMLIQNEDSWRYLRVVPETEIPISKLNGVNFDSTKQISIVISKGKNSLDGYIVNNLDKEIEISRLDGLLDKFSTAILKDTTWTEFQKIDHSGYTCGNSFYTVSLASKDALPFQIDEMTQGEIKTKMRASVIIQGQSYLSNEIEITLTKAQFDSTGTPIKPRHFDKQYEDYIAMADQFYMAKQYEEAKANYQIALGFHSWEIYPQEQIKKCDKLLKPKVGE